MVWRREGILSGRFVATTLTLKVDVACSIAYRSRRIRRSYQASKTGIPANFVGACLKCLGRMPNAQMPRSKSPCPRFTGTRFVILLEGAVRYFTAVSSRLSCSSGKTSSQPSCYTLTSRCLQASIHYQQSQWPFRDPSTFRQYGGMASLV